MIAAADELEAVRPKNSKEKAMIRNDLHVHSIQSMCGLHTLLEIVEIAARKGMRLVNISDHGSAFGEK